jgi:ribosomal protein L29
MENRDSKSLRESIYLAKKDLFDLRIRQSAGSLSDTSQIRKKRRLVALLYTNLNSNSLQKRISK